MRWFAGAARERGSELEIGGGGFWFRRLSWSWTRTGPARPVSSALRAAPVWEKVTLALFHSSSLCSSLPFKVASTSTLSDRGRHRKRGESRGRPSRTTRSTNWRRGFCTRSTSHRPTETRSRSSWGSPTRRSSPGSRTAGPNSSGTWRRWKRTWSR